jgi:putative transposase
MARFARVVAIETAHHVTQRGIDQQKVFFTDADRNIYLDCLTKFCAQARTRILAYCLMSNHVHLVLVPEEPHSLAVAMRRTHSRYATYLNARRDRAGHLWQNRFFSCPMDDAHLWVALRYVERNPVRANLVARPEEYPWSSAAAHVGADRSASRLLDWSFHANAGGNERWRALLAESEDLDEIRRLQRGTFTGRPVGSPEFVARLEKELGRPLAPRSGPGIGSSAKATAS